jgi:hypothetical protein
MDADPILLAKGWEGDIDNVDTSKLQVHKEDVAFDHVFKFFCQVFRQLASPMFATVPNELHNAIEM